MTTLQIFQQVFNCYCIIFCTYICFRWTTKTFQDSMIKVSLFLAVVVGIVLELHTLNVIS